MNFSMRIRRRSSFNYRLATFTVLVAILTTLLVFTELLAQCKICPAWAEHAEKCTTQNQINIFLLLNGDFQCNASTRSVKKVDYMIRESERLQYATVIRTRRL